MLIIGAYIEEVVMPITSEVLREGRVVLFTYPKAFTMAEVNAIYEGFEREILAKATRKVHTIADLSAVTEIPPNVLSLSVGMTKKSHPGIGTIFIVTPQRFINSLAGLLTKLVPNQKVLIRESVEEALKEADRLIASEVSENRKQA